MRRLLTLAVALALGATACGGDDSQDVTARDVLASTSTVSPELEGSPTTTTAADGAHPWCAAWARVRDAEEPSDEDLRAAVDGAPGEVRDEVAALTGADPDEDLEIDAVAAQVGALATVEAWSHEHCGTSHAFCLAWPVFTVAILSSAFSGEVQGDDAPEGLEELARVALDHAPPELAHLATEVEGTLGDADLSAEEERAAETAYDAYDAWVEDHCGP